ncbi:S-layer homology domain-containing protein [Paenibacillus daejeonensis]|uniref:S-layer homology domain-containing protein n=1 Tax=Paenibacillus daejeonensis TaxID=135193 RepID=UPI00039E7FDB|nr:S-layer homology domain-containing protein [Paenibacillus daejeonensis]
MMRRQWGLMSLCILLVAAALPWTAAMAAEDTKLFMTGQTSTTTGAEVKVTVRAEQLQQLYGYELQLAYDEEQLRYVRAEANWQGFSVPLNEEGVLTFAHTKLGNSAGENGSKDLATFTFQPLAAGDTEVQLIRAKLVDSAKQAVTLTPNATQTIAVTAVEEPEPEMPVSFTDTDGHWAESLIGQAAAIGFVSGYPDGTFRPNGHVTRAEFVTMLARALQLPEASTDAAWLDAAAIPAWAKSYIDQVQIAGIVTGYEDGSFRPQQLITRSELAVMIARSRGAELVDGAKPTFTDVASIPAWAQLAVAYAQQAGYIEGRGQGQFAPTAHATRAEAVKLILTVREAMNR